MSPPLPPGFQPVVPGRRNTSRTDAIRRNGLQGLRDWEQSRQGAADPTMRRQFLESGGRPLSGADNPFYEQWSRGSTAPTQYDVLYGRTPEGDYSGFKNASDLKAAVQGYGETLRNEDRDRALAMQQLAEQYLGQMETDYEKNYVRGVPTREEIARTQHMPSPGSPSEMAAIAQVAPQVEVDPRVYGGHMPSPGSPSEMEALMAFQTPGTIPTSGQADLVAQMRGANDYLSTQTRRNADEASRRNADESANRRLADEMAAVNTAGARLSAETADDRAYNDALNSWLADNAGQYQDAIDAADLVMQEPGRDYWLKAAAEYGVDPNIARGWYDEASMIRDFTEQRDLAAIDQYGMPYSEFQGFIGDQQRAEDAAVDDAAAADEQAMDQYVQDVTGFDPQQLATSADVNVPMLYDLVSTPEFQEATSAIINAAANPDDVQGILDQWMEQDPVLYRVLDSMFGDYGVE